MAEIKSVKPIVILVANQHTGAIVIPRAVMQGEQRMLLAPLELQAGSVTPVDAEEWKERKKLTVIQHYLDRGLLREVKTDGPVPVMDATSTNLEDVIPANLKSENELTQGAAAAKVTKTKVGEVTVG